MSYAEAWREDRRRWRWLLLWALGLPVGFMLFVFGLGGLVLLLEHLLPPRQEEWLRALLEQGPSPDALFPIVMILWAPGCVLLSFKVFMFACLRELLSGYLASRGTSREWIQRASHDELVREAATLTSRGPPR